MQQKPQTWVSLALAWSTLRAVFGETVVGAVELAVVPVVVVVRTSDHNDRVFGIDQELAGSLGSHLIRINKNSIKLSV